MMEAIMAAMCKRGEDNKTEVGKRVSRAKKNRIEEKFFKRIEKNLVG
ncbi:MAG: hypothetical protein WBL76_01380 [Bacteroidales bacterium]